MWDAPPLLTGSYVQTLDPPLVMLFGKVMDTIGGGASLGGVCHMGQALRLSGLIFTLCVLSGDVVWPASFLLLPPWCPCSLPCLSCQYGMYLSRTVRKIISPSPLGCFSQGIFITATGKQGSDSLSCLPLSLQYHRKSLDPGKTHFALIAPSLPPLSPSSPKAAPILPTLPLQGPLLSGNLFTLIGSQLLDEAFTICSWWYLAHAKHSVNSKSNPNPKQNKHENQNPTKN